MRISDLKKLFAGTIGVLSFKELISKEVMLYERFHIKKGNSIPIELIEDEKFFFGKIEFIFLCKLYVAEALNKYEISYVSEAILLSTNVELENDLIKECLDLFSDLENDERLSEKDVTVMIHRMIS